MATIQQDILVQADAEHVWAAFRDFGAVHTRLARGFVTDCRLEESTLRVVTFANGLVAKERIVTVDDTKRRLAYSITQGRPTHHNASFQVVPEGDARCRVIWIADLLPDELAGPIGEMMAAGSAAMKKTLEGKAS